MKGLILQYLFVPFLSSVLCSGMFGSTQEQGLAYKGISTYNVSARSKYDYPFQDPSLSLITRLNDLVDVRLSIDDLVPQSMALYDQVSPPIDRYNISPYAWATECISGCRRTNGTAFPQPIGMSSSFSVDLLEKVAAAISTETRAFWNTNRKQGKYIQRHGITCFSPVINLMRHPYWGRNTETYGEDPYLTGEMARAYVTGLQGHHPRYVRASATCKHFDVHGGPENIPTPRYKFNAEVSMRDWRMTFLPAFKACVDAGALGVMCSFNSINGIPACANEELLTGMLRDEWRFPGFVVTDSGAIEKIKTGHQYIKHWVDVTAAAINAGTNLELGTDVYRHIEEAIAERKLTAETFRESMKQLFLVRMKLGEFDPEEYNPYNFINMTVVQSPEHRQLAVQMAAASFVLLKNNGILPLSKTYGKAAFVGPFSNNVDLIFGGYSPDANLPFIKTPFDGLKSIANTTSYASGCHDNTVPKCNKYNGTDIQAAVTGADIVFVSLGLSRHLESEGNDRNTLKLPGKQLQLLKDSVKYATAPVIVLLFNAAPLDISWAKHSDGVSAIMECFYPGQATGEALYRSLTANYQQTPAYYVPAGRLTATWPMNDSQVPSITNYNMSDGFTYRYSKVEPLYPFGYGLSYTRFLYNGISLSKTTITAGEKVEVILNVANDGPLDADEVVQIYLSWSNVSLPAPRLQLVAFRRIHIIARSTIVLSPITIEAEKMQIWIDDYRKWIIPPGSMVIYAGGQQPGHKTDMTSNVLQAELKIVPF